VIKCGQIYIVHGLNKRPHQNLRQILLKLFTSEYFVLIARNSLSTTFIHLYLRRKKASNTEIEENCGNHKMTRVKCMNVIRYELLDATQ